MANVEGAKKKLLAAKESVNDCLKSIQELQAKTDQLQDSLPGLSREVENVGKIKQIALDNFALHSNKESESELKRARAGYESAVKQRAETNELIEACDRGLKKQESEFARLNNASEMAKRQCWQAVADEIKSAIPSEVFESIKKLQVIGSQCGQTRPWLLDRLFPNIPSGEFQTIRSELVEKYGID